MLLGVFAVVLGCIVLNSKIHTAKGSNATSTLSNNVQATPSTMIATMQSSPAPSTISPTTTSTVPQATQSVVPVPTVPTVPSTTYKRTYGFIVTLENLPYTTFQEQEQFEKYNEFLDEMKVLFKNGSFPEYKKLDTAQIIQNQLFSNDSGKVRTKFKAMFDAVPAQSSKEPEMYFRLKNFQKGSKYKFYAVPSTIKVEEKVEGGAVLGNWTTEGDIPKFCCGEGVYQTRYCSQSQSASCDGLHLKRTMPCQLIYPIKCGKVRKFTFNLTLANDWKDGYKDSSSSEYKEFVAKLTTGEGSMLEEMKKMFKNSKTGYKEVDHTSFQMFQDNGKVLVSITLLFEEPPSNPEDPEALFRFKTDSGKLGNFQINTKSISIEESAPGYTFTPWTNKASECNICCGGELQQTRTCQSKMGSCPDAQVTRSIRCKHVCHEVKCADSSMTVPYVLGILICVLASSFLW